MARNKKDDGTRMTRFWVNVPEKVKEALGVDRMRELCNPVIQKAYNEAVEKQTKTLK